MTFGFVKNFGFILNFFVDSDCFAYTYDINIKTDEIMSHIHNLPYLPVSIPALMEMAFFQSKDARIVRAGLWMMEAAWRTSKPGTIPSGYDSLAAITRLSVDEIEANYEVLTEGWTLERDGRLHHETIKSLADNLTERFGAELEVFAESAALACQGGVVEFELVSTDAVKKKKRLGKHVLPANFVMDKTTADRVFSEGYTTPELQTWLLNEFTDFARSGARRYADWQATLRNFMSSDITRDKFKSKFGHPLGYLSAAALETVAGHDSCGTYQGATSAGASERLRSRLRTESRPESFAARTASQNSDLMANALARRAAASVHAGFDGAVYG